jgi:hypothetical protein
MPKKDESNENVEQVKNVFKVSVKRFHGVGFVGFNVFVL